jgi:hypothetical protein
MWRRDHQDEGGARASSAEAIEGGCRRSYFRVTGMLPIRLHAVEPADLDAEIFDLSMPDPLLQPVGEEGEVDSPLMERLRRLEEKLDLLLGQARLEVPRPLSGRDRRSVTFSGAGLALDVSWSFRRGDYYKVEVLLPPPYSRLVRCLAEAVEDAPRSVGEGGRRLLPLAIRHMEDEERDALVAYSYDLQRAELRARGPREISA